MQSMPQKSTRSSEGDWGWFGCCYGGCIVWNLPRFSYYIWLRTWWTTFGFGSSSSQGSVATLERDLEGFGFLQLERDVSDSLISLSWAESCLSILRCDIVFSSEQCFPRPFSSVSWGPAKRRKVCAELSGPCSKRLRFFLMLSRLLIFSPQYFLRKLQLELEDFMQQKYYAISLEGCNVLSLQCFDCAGGRSREGRLAGGVEGFGWGWDWVIFKMRKRNHRIHDYQTMGKKILCGQFADRLKNNFAVGDEENNLILYGLVNAKPITVLSPQNNSNNVTAMTSLTFTSNDDQIIVGSSRGLINIWDLNTLKINSTLKGHTIEVSVLACDRSSENLLASGSADTSVKLWDLRTKNAVLTFKTHRKRVNAITTTRARLLLSGGDDCNFNAYDLKMMKPFFSQQLQASVLCLDSSQQLSAAGCMDRLARIHDVESNKFIGCTKSETMPISSVVFHQSNFLFTAGTDNLKVWDLSSDIMMTDNIESGSKGILHMTVSDRVQQIAFSGGGLSYHQCFLSDINFKGPYIFSNHSISYEKSEKAERVDEAIERNNNIKRGNSNNPIALITNEKTKLMIGKRNDSLAKQLSDVTENVNDALSNIKRASEEFSKRRNEGAELQEMMGEEHAKFLQIMSQRAKSIQNMLDLWMKGNLKLLIQSLKNTDIYVVSDVLAQILRPSKVTISAEFGFIIAERAKEMIGSKHLTLVKAGLEYMLQVVSLFKDEMIKLKTFGTDRGGVDLAREERLRRYDLLIEQYVEVYQSHRLKKLAEKKDEASRLAEQLSSQLAFIFKKVFGTDYEL